jgi:1,4-alpha-glucan branching enzyme
MWTQPGKKLLFMGCEFAQPEEWNHDSELNWGAAEQPANKGVQRLVQDLNRMYRDTPSLYVKDCDPDGFQWVCNDPAQSVTAYLRKGGDANVLVVCNFSGVERSDFRIGVPYAGRWSEILNTDSAIYGGDDRGNMGHSVTHHHEPHEFDQSLFLTIPPLSVIVLKHDPCQKNQ